MVQHLWPFTLASARVKGAAPLPADKKRASPGAILFSSSFCWVFSRSSSAPVSLSHRSTFILSATGRVRDFSFNRRNFSQPENRGTSNSTTSAPVNREIHPATPLDWDKCPLIRSLSMKTMEGRMLRARPPPSSPSPSSGLFPSLPGCPRWGRNGPLSLPLSFCSHVPVSSAVPGIRPPTGGWRAGRHR